LSNLLREFLGRQSSSGIDLDHAVPHPGPGRRLRPSIRLRNPAFGRKLAGRIGSDQQVSPRRSLANIARAHMDAIHVSTGRTMDYFAALAMTIWRQWARQINFAL